MGTDTDAMTALLTPGRQAPARPSKPPRTGGLRLWVALIGLLTYTGIILAATLTPTPLDRGYESSIDSLLGVLHRNGVPDWFGYDKLEFSANVLMFVPLGFFLALVLPRAAWWLALLLIPAFSAAIELSQAVFLSERFATVEDVLANSLGGFLGALVAFVIRALVHARDQRVIARALWERQHHRRR